jgi:hypothetical protein
MMVRRNPIIHRGQAVPMEHITCGVKLSLRLYVPPTGPDRPQQYIR